MKKKQNMFDCGPIGKIGDRITIYGQGTFTVIDAEFNNLRIKQSVVDWLRYRSSIGLNALIKLSHL